jgi:predicted DNA-binding transcriptional regulator AlpA
MKEKLLTCRQVSQILGISEQEIIKLAKEGYLPHAVERDEFLRFSRRDVLAVKDEVSRKYNVKADNVTLLQKINDFFYFNNFYIISLVILVILLVIVFQKKP